VTIARPDLDPELLDLLAEMPNAPPLSDETLEMIRPYATIPAETALAGHAIERQDLIVASSDRGQIPLTILKPAGVDLTSHTAACVYWVHGGGMVMGDRFSQIDIPLDWLTRLGSVVVTVDYRLAPDVSGITLVEDCYAGLVWTAEHADEIGFDAAKLVVAGTSAGGGLAAGTTLLARDRSGPAIAAQVLICPMLDHRNDTTSSFRLPRGQPLGTWHLPGARDQFDATLSADGQYLATTGGGRGEVPTKDPIRIWNVARRSVVRTLPSVSVSAVYFSPDDSRLVIEQVHSEFGVPTVTVDNLVTGGSVRIALPTACDSSEGDFVISRNDRTLASESFCGYADVWSLPSGRLLRQVNQGGEASSVDLSPDGSRLLVSSWDSRATIWSVRTGHRLVNLIGDTRGINAAGFNPDGQLVVTESLDHTVRLWDAHTGQELRVLTFPYDQDDFAFSVNGQQLAISENTPLLNVDDVVRVFDTCPDCTNPHGLLQLSAHQITTQLTELERTVVDAAGDS
jgi:hypothetical protein